MGRVIDQYQMAKHFTLAIDDAVFTYTRKTDAITAEAALDGIYIIRTSVTDAGRTRAAGGIAVAIVRSRKSDGPISGFVKNGDTIGDQRNADLRNH